MVKVVGNILSPALLNQLVVLQKTADTIDEVQLRLATGKKVNSAKDDPDNFFVSRKLKNTASDYSRLLDGIGQNVRALEETSIGLQATGQLIDQAEAVVQKTRDFLIDGQVDPAVFEEIVNVSPPTLSTQIQNESPDVYYRLNETAGPIIDYGVGAAGPVAATYNSGASPGAPALYTNGAAPSVQFDGTNDRIRVSDSTMINTAPTPARTIELVFNADDVSGRQILFEEGAGVNGITIYIDNGSVYFTAEDDSGGNRYADLNVNAPIVAGQTYHVALVLNAVADTFAGYLDGQLINELTNIGGDALFPSHSGDIGIGGMNGSVQWHDGESGGGNGFNFDGRISDVAIYNRALNGNVIASHANSLDASTSTLYYNRDYNAIVDQINDIAFDAHYNGANLLLGETLTTFFNPDRTSSITTFGDDFTEHGLGLRRTQFNNLDDVNDILDALGEAREKVRGFVRTIATDITVLQIRTDFTKETINTHESGSDDLILSDQNQDGAELLATQTRQALGVTALSLAALSDASILRVI